MEFHEEYKNLLRSALSNPKRKLILVVDNLDRLDSENALLMWATMKTFLDYGAIKGEEWSKRLWLIVPFDPKALVRIWQNEDLSKAGNAPYDQVAEPFVDKTFQLTFHVPPPVLSNWVQYFTKKAHEALPKVGPREDTRNVSHLQAQNIGSEDTPNSA